MRKLFLILFALSSFSLLAETVSGGGSLNPVVPISLTFTGNDTATVSAINTGKIYFDLSEQKFKLSMNNGAYVDLFTGGTVTAVTASLPLSSSGGNTPNITLGIAGVANGGTGVSTVPSNGFLPIGNGTNYVSAALTGTTNQVVVTNGAGSVTLSTPQSIGTGSSPTFTGLTLTAPLSYANGGTGQSTYAAGDFVYASAINTLSKLTIGSSTNVLTVTGGVPVWAAPAAPAVTNGGTGQTTYATGDTLYASGANTLAKRTIGSSGDVLTVTGGVPVWAAPAAAGASLSANQTFTGINSFQPTGGGSGTGNESIGLTAGDSMTTGATNNTFFGTNAGTAITTSDDNTLLGYNAGATSTATNMVGIGSGVFPAIVTGTDNTAVGKAAGGTVVGGTNNVFVGSSTRTAGTGDSNSVVIGKSARVGGTGVTIGSGAGFSVNGAANVSIGYSAQASLDGGASNTAIGTSSAATLTSGSNNVFVGDSANSTDAATATAVAVGASSKVAVNGIAIGYATFPAMSGTGGTDNIAIGKSAGGTLTTGTNNVMVGSLTVTSATGTADGVAIGKSARVAVNGVSIGSGSSTSVTGTSNTAVGKGSGTSLTSGTENVMIGTDALTAASGTSSSVTIGVGAASATNGVAIGRSAGSSSGVTGTDNTLVGYNGPSGLTTGTNNVFVGSTTAAGASDTGSAVAIGKSAKVAVNGVSIGSGSGPSLTTGTDNTFVGRGAGTTVSTGDSNTFLGSGTTGIAASVGAIALGRGATTTASAQWITGSSSYPITDVFIGRGVTAASADTNAAVTINATGGTGNNNWGADLTLAAGRSTGNAAPGVIFFQTGTSIGGGGSTAQTLSTRMGIDETYISAYIPFTSIGVADASNATAGYVGQVISNSRATATTFTTSGVLQNFQFDDTTTKITLTAGDWNVSAILAASKDAATAMTVNLMALSTNSASLTGTAYGDSYVAWDGPTANLITTTIPDFRVNVSTTTDIYFVIRADFTTATTNATYRGRISARRVR